MAEYREPEGRRVKTVGERAWAINFAGTGVVRLQVAYLVPVGTSETFTILMWQRTVHVWFNRLAE